MTIQITVEGRNIMFRLDWKHWRWHSLDAPQEVDFPLITVVDDKRYELYSGWNVRRGGEVSARSAKENSEGS